ncbi:ExeM/NucH family extracellular endonuclease [Nocardioides sp.]|uniref:ExeM/NucH family extracellular endonuclease n=1 Tax=Nocardioides sp. TaxID=35761 RepID=UPI003516C5CB
MRPANRLLCGALGTALSLSGLTALAAPAAQAAPDGSGLVISEVYGAGGNSGAVYNADFVELANPTSSAVSLDGLALHYRSAAGGSGGAPLALRGSVPAGGHYLVQMSAAGTTGKALPTPDATASYTMAAAGGQVALQRGTTVVTATGDMAGVDGIVDFFGAPGAASFEKRPSASAATAAKSLNRTGTAGAGDSDDNAADFVLADPTPTASGTGAPVDPPVDPPVEPGTPVAIADIQGSGTTSPLVDKSATTEGVVTAVYPTGGFNGFYIQTAGADTTPGRSDGLFVFTGTAGSKLEGLAVGDSVRVAGTVKEFGGLTELDVAAGSVTEIASLGAVVPNTVVPGTDCALPGTGCATAAQIDAAREEVEGEAFAPTAALTVTDVYDGSASNPPSAPSGNHFGEIGLAVGDQPLITPTDVIDAQDTAAIAARKAYNDAHRIILDDGSSTTYWNTSNTAAGKDSPLPYVTRDHHVRVGAKVTFDAPVVLDYRFGWKLQPQRQVVGKPTGLVTFEQNRPAAPAAVGGALKLATFNVLNYFTTLGKDVAGCTSYKDRTGTPIAVNSCPGNGPRGAWDQANFERQQAKIVAAISTIDADVVSVEEIENSLVVDGAGTPRDEALAALVAALNVKAGAGTWDYVRSPAEASAPENIGYQDVIRTGFIYRTASVEVDGAARMLFGDPAFDNAREPFAAIFKPKGGADASRFAVIVNHFKSKGSGTDDGTGQGNANPDRVKQANALAAFAADVSAQRKVDAVFLAGDFNAYSKEDPIQALEAAGYRQLGAEGKYSYSFDGQSGSLDHVLANPAAAKLVTGADVWEINANETLYNQYSRYNYTGTDLYAPDPFGASDHNPEVVGINPVAAPSTADIQVLGTNDFHGRLLADGANAGGAAVLAGAVEKLRAQNPNTVFAAAGDLIGASTFESFVANDAPTIDALNAAGLEVSAAGNHEFDQGYEDFVGRVQDRAKWTYIGANVEEPAGRDDLAETWTKDIGGVTVGFVGAVTEDLPTLVSPGGIQGVTVTEVVKATNQAAASLRAGGADVVVLLVHEGAADTSCTSAQFTDPGTTWGNIVQNVSPDVDAIISGHTHKAYNCAIPVKKWADDGRAVTTRPVVSAGQYGTNLNKLTFKVDVATGQVKAADQAILSLTDGSWTPDPAVQKIVDDAKAAAEELGRRLLGKLAGPFNRAKLADGTTENRGGESTLGNLVAEVQRWATRNPESGSAQIAFMNPGGLRADLAGTLPAEGGDRTLTYKQAAVVQPFANTLVNLKLTGAQIKTVLEQQWQRTSTGTVPSRPFLRLGVSKGFTYTYTEEPVTVAGAATTQGTVTGMWLDGKPIDPAATYSVTVNQFLSTGGDNFFEFAKGATPVDTGKVDLQAMVDYMAQYATTPLAVDAAQRAVRVEFPADAPSSYDPGAPVRFTVGSLAMTAPGDAKDTSLEVRLGEQVLGTVAVDNTVGTTPSDQSGTASVDVVLPASISGGATELTLVGTTTGTRVTVPIAVTEKAEPSPLVNTALPTVAGTARVGATLVARPGTWEPEATAYRYQWLVDGRVIAGATGATLRVTRAMLTHRLSVRVTASAEGSASATATSRPTAPVQRGLATVITRVIPGGKVVAGRTRVSLAVRVGNPDGLPTTGRVLVRIGTKVWSGRLQDGRVVVPLGVLRVAGLRVIHVRYLGNDVVGQGTATTAVSVQRR